MENHSRLINKNFSSGDLAVDGFTPPIEWKPLMIFRDCYNKSVVINKSDTFKRNFDVSIFLSAKII